MKFTLCKNWNSANGNLPIGTFTFYELRLWIRFPFRYREKLRVHALRVMAVVEKTIHRLNSETKAAVVNSKMVLNFE